MTMWDNKVFNCDKSEDKLVSSNCLIQCVIGDFNIKPFEKSRGERSSHA